MLSFYISIIAQFSPYQSDFKGESDSDLESDDDLDSGGQGYIGGQTF